MSLFAASQLSAHAQPVNAQSVTAATDGTGTRVTAAETADGTQFTIDQGTLSADDTNLFHSFESFSINAGDSANFLAQPSVQNILTRVSGGTPSILNGLLQVTSEGTPNLFLMNPAGVLFGAEAVLNVPANFTVTSADAVGFGSAGGQIWFGATGETNYAALSGEPSGEFAFLSERPGSVVNAGDLTFADGAAVVLLGGTVVNTGALSAPNGSITLTAVSDDNVVRLSQENNLLSLELATLEQSTPMGMSGPAASMFTPLDLPALLTYGDAAHATGLSVAADGSVRLTSTAGTDSSVLPTSMGDVIASGRLSVDSPNGQGGQIAVLGDRVLALNAQLSASGRLGGGNLRLGGDYQGQGPLLTADRTFVSADTVITANAIDSGNGGRVILWADGNTGFFGDISANGGDISGNGGFVEISGKQNLTFQGTVTTHAPQGEAGVLLLDPASIFIRASAPQADDDQVIADGIINGNDGPFGGGEGTSFSISEESLESLSGNTNIFLEATEEIFVESLLDGVLTFAQGTGSITLQADRDIFVEDPSFSIVAPQRSIQITASNISLGDINNAPTGGAVGTGGDITLSATTGYYSSSDISVGNITTAGNVTGNNGSVTLEALDNIIAGNITTGDPSNSNAGERGGDVTLTSINDSSISVGDIDTRDEVNGSFTLLTGGSANIGIINNGEVDNLEDPLEDPFDDFFFEDDLFEDDFFGDDFGDDFGDEGEALLSDDLLSLDGEGDDFIDDEDGSTELDDGFEDELEDSVEDELDGELEEFDDTLEDAFDDVEFETELLELEVDIVDELLLEVDGANSDEYSAYLGLDAVSQELTLEDIQSMLANIEMQSGTRSAAIYINVPASEADQDKAGSKQINDRKNSGNLEIVVITADGTPIKAAVSGVTRSQLFDTITTFRGDVVSSARRGSDYYLSSAQLLYQWLIAPIESELASASIDTLVFSMDEGLRSLPIAALHDGEQFLVEKYSLGIVPSLSLIDAQYEPMNDAQVLAMGASSFERLSPLPAVPVELELINELWPGAAFLNEDFTRQNLVEQRQESPYRLIHLATHAEFKAGSAEDSYIQLWDEQLKLNELHRFGWEYPAVDLLVLSACSTAVGSPEAEMGFAGLAIASGVRSAMASLWSVSDVGTLALMSEFYGQLQVTSTKSEALRAAQLAMLQGEVRTTEDGELMRSASRSGVSLPSELSTLGASDFSHPYYWSGFTMIGSPW
ncbi:MAG: CHAT domain-containing protein [Cyanobacteria bacterium P01_D01_bin.36]